MTRVLPPPVAVFLFVVFLATIASGIKRIGIKRIGIITKPKQVDLRHPSSSFPILPRNTSILFVKFHKVAGTTIMRQLNDVMEANNQCQHSCIDHPCSLYLAMNEMPKVAANNETTIMMRRQFEYNVRNIYRTWLPRDSSLKVFTLLRDPAERLRSKYYFQRSNGWCAKNHGDKCGALQLTFLEWMTYEMDGRDLQKTGSNDKEACCEYVQTLGGPNMDVDIALRALKLFDVVGVTEHLEASFAEMIRVISGGSGSGSGGTTNENDRDTTAVDDDTDTYTDTVVRHERDNSDNKKPWTAEERAAADHLTQKDRIIYEEALRRAASWINI